MELDDILREADPEYYAQQGNDGDYEGLNALYVAERSAPELLDWPDDGLIDRVNEKIQHQIEKVEEMTGNMDPKTNFSLIVIQTELERWKYLVRIFLRARLAKLVKYSSHYLSSSEMRQRLSPMEASFARRHDDLLQKHYNMAFLQSFPPQLRRMDDTTGGTSMIDLPDLDTPVFIRARKACVVFGRGITSDDEVDAHPGEVLIARWSDVKPLYLNGDVELV